MKAEVRSKFILFPYSLWMAAFAVVPLGLVAVLSFTGADGGFTFSNILSVGKYSSVFLRSIWLGFLSTFVCLVLGYPVAYFVSKFKSKNQNIIITLIMVPMWMNFLLRTYAWMTILENNGLLNYFLSFLGLPKLDIINTPAAVVLGMVYNFLPYMILPIYTSLIKTDKKVVEAAQDLGANKFQIFTKITFPLTLAGVISGITMVFVPAVSTFIISKLLGGGSIMVIGDLIEMQFLGGTYNPHLGCAISLILMIIIMICTNIVNLFDKNTSKN